MSISDDLMWRYYELLTDKKMADIDQMKSGMHPMDAKKQLAAQIVRDFHGDQAAQQAAENWARQFQKDEVPEEIASIKVPLEKVYVKDVEYINDPASPYYPLFEMEEVKPGSFLPLLRLDKIIAAAGLSSSNSEASRKLKERAVRIDGNVVVVNQIASPVPSKEFALNVGRHWKKVQVVK